jgi:hypothetical protein
MAPHEFGEGRLVATEQVLQELSVVHVENSTVRPSTV